MARTVLAAMLAIVLVPAVVLTNVAAWSLRTILDDDAFAATIGRSLDTPAVEGLIADRVATVVVDAIDLGDPLERRFGALALGLVPTIGAAGLEAAIEDRVLVALQDPRVESARDQVVRAAHDFLIGAARGSNTVVRVDGDEVVVDLYPIVVQAAGAIDPRLLGVVEQRVDPAEAQLVVARSEGVQTVQTGVAVLDAMRIAIPALTLLVAVLIVVIAHRHTRALGIVGVAAMIAGVVSLGLVWAFGAAAPTAIDNGTLQAIATEVYGELTSALVLQSVLLLGLGAVIASGPGPRCGHAAVACPRQRARRVPRSTGTRPRTGRCADLGSGDQASGSIRSMIVAMPWPTPMHIVARP